MKISVGVDYRPIDYIRDFRDLDFIATWTNVNIGLTYLSAPYVLHAPVVSIKCGILVLI